MYLILGCKYFKWLGDVAKTSRNNFDWMKDISQFNECFIKNYNEESDK